MATSLAVYGMASKTPAEQPRMEQKGAMTHAVLVCPDCHVVALKAGKCDKCGKELVQKHLLSVQNGQATLCGCSAGCTCDAKGVKDGKCACGKEVTMASCTGMYCCPKGCPAMSDKPGKCPGCGMDMKKSE